MIYYQMIYQHSVNYLAVKIFFSRYTGLPQLECCLLRVVDDYTVIFLVSFPCQSIHYRYCSRFTNEMCVFSSGVLMGVSFYLYGYNCSLGLLLFIFTCLDDSGHVLLI